MLTNEEVLITILLLSRDTEDQAVPSADVARLLQVTRAAMHNRIIKLIEKGLLVKGARKKLCFTPEGLAYTTCLAKDFDRLQSFYAQTGGLPQAEAKSCAYAIISALPEESRRRLLPSMENHVVGVVDPYEATGLTEKTIEALMNQRRKALLNKEGDERNALLNETLVDEEFHSLLDEIALLRKEWKSIQAEKQKEPQKETQASSVGTDAVTDGAKHTKAERATFIKWRYSQSIERYFHRKIGTWEG